MRMTHTTRLGPVYIFPPNNSFTARLHSKDQITWRDVLIPFRLTTHLFLLWEWMNEWVNKTTNEMEHRQREEADAFDRKNWKIDIFTGLILTSYLCNLFMHLWSTLLLSPLVSHSSKLGMDIIFAVLLLITFRFFYLVFIIIHMHIMLL